MPPTLPPSTLSPPWLATVREELAALAAEVAGLELGAVGEAAVERFVERAVRDGTPAPVLRERARAREPALLEALLEALLVGETFFFREPEHFQLVRDVAAASPRRALAAWSAGCASGEEAYSLAATLLAVAAGRPVEVLGTDLSARALARAAAGAYGRWSRRDAGPMLYPVLDPADTGGGVLRILGELRRTVRYARHNLLDPPPAPAGGFDVVMCRNVFVYLRPDAARRVSRHLADALAEGGLLIVGNLGGLDEAAAPALEPIGPRELGAYVRRPASQAVDARPRRKTRETGPPPPGPTLTAGELAEHVASHLRALHLIEARRFAEAEALLSGLVGAGGYVPALLELALLAERRGRPSRATELAARVLELLERRDPDAEVAGPEPLPVRYYTTIAHTFLARLRGRA